MVESNTNQKISLFALSSIHLCTGEMKATGDFDADGVPEVEPVVQIVAPGSTFAVDRAEADRLLQGGHAAYPGSEDASVVRVHAAGVGL